MRIYRILPAAIIFGMFFFLSSCIQDLSPVDGGTTETVDLQDGLVAYYPFTGNLQDESGNGHDGISHATALTADRHGTASRALSLQGTMMSFMEVPHHADLNLSGDFTICFWIYAPNAVPGYSVVLGKGQDISNFYGLIFDDPGYQSSGGSGGQVANFLLTNSSGKFQACAENYSTGANNWQFIALCQSQEANKQGLYIDESFIAEKPYYSFTANNDYPLIIGRHFVLANGSGDYEYPFKGNIDDLRIYDRALNRSELQALYEE